MDSKILSGLVLIGFFLFSVSAASAASTWYVAPSPVGTGTSGGSCAAPGYNTISAAITAAGIGDTINVCAGTYVEQVTISQDLILNGAGSGTTTVKAPAVLLPDTFGYYNIITIFGATTNAEISGFTISGPGPSNCGSLHTGIFVQKGAYANIHDNVVADIRDNPLSGCQNGVGILVGRAAFATTGSADIKDNTITNYQKGGIVVNNAGSSANVVDNTVTGAGATTMIAQNGIQISSGGTGTITGNSVSGNLCDHASCGPDPMTQTQSTGILLFGVPGGVVVSGNTVFDNDIGIYNIATGITDINNNVLTNNRYEGVILDQGDALVVDNKVIGGNIGVLAVSYTGNTADSMGTLMGNTITGAGTGIKLLDEITTDPYIPRIVAHDNNIFGNGIGFDNTISTAMDALRNWWGSQSGPSGAGPGTGDSISANVLIDPWLCQFYPIEVIAINGTCPVRTPSLSPLPMVMLIGALAVIGAKRIKA
jgi:hypothetical protein